IRGDDLMSMLRAACGDGHPPLWFLMLRAAYSVVGRPEVLPGIALLVAIAAALLLLLKAPFPWPVICLILLGHYFLFEYSVMAQLRHLYGAALRCGNSLPNLAEPRHRFGRDVVSAGQLQHPLRACRRRLSNLLVDGYSPGNRASVVASAEKFHAE